MENINGIFERNIMYWGEEFQKKLTQKHIFIFGLGGVGGYVADSLARCGIGELTLIDFDVVSKSNINRQIMALNSTIGLKKTSVLAKRLQDINPNIVINIIDEFYSEKLNEKIFNIKPDFVVDAIDTYPKVHLLKYCYENNIPIISSMGVGKRLDPTQLFIADISEGKKLSCKFVKKILNNLKNYQINSGISAIFSNEPAQKSSKCMICKNKEDIQFTEIPIKEPLSSTPVVPPVAGYFIVFFILKHFSK